MDTGCGSVTIPPAPPTHGCPATGLPLTFTHLTFPFYAFRYPRVTCRFVTDSTHLTLPILGSDALRLPLVIVVFTALRYATRCDSYATHTAPPDTGCLHYRSTISAGAHITFVVDFTFDYARFHSSFAPRYVYSCYIDSRSFCRLPRFLPR